MEIKSVIDENLSGLSRECSFVPGAFGTEIDKFRVDDIPFKLRIHLKNDNWRQMKTAELVNNNIESCKDNPKRFMETRMIQIWWWNDYVTL